MFGDYFTRLYEASGAFVAGLELPQEAFTLDILLARTRDDIESRSAAIVAGFIDLRPQPGRPGTAPVDNAVGMNTVGMLCDRLTVLAMKEWVLRCRLGKPAEARQLRETQVDELIQALARVSPGHSSFTQKLTKVRVELAVNRWEDAYFGLLATNVLLWESQEVLYGGRIERLACEELRRYIAWFSEGNIRRNLFIAACEPLFWRLADEGA